MMSSFRTRSLVLLAALGVAAIGIVAAQRMHRRNGAALVGHKNVLLVIVDTLGTRHMGAYNPSEAPGTTPSIDALAANGIMFERAYSTAPWTKPSIGSIFTAQMPSVHGVRSTDTPLKPAVPTLAERMKAAGYRTAGFVSHTLIAPRTGYSKGFDTYKMVKLRKNVHDSITSDQVTDMALEWLSSNEKTTKPFFLFLHYFDPHFNYQHHERFDRSSGYKGPLTPGMPFGEVKARANANQLTDEDADYLKALYREEIAFTDQEIGRLLNEMKEKGLLDDTLVIFTADHGEEFKDHGGIGHGRTLYDDLIHVPFVMSMPGTLEPGRVTTPVSTMDLTPTLLDLVGVSVKDPAWQGVSLTPLISGAVAERPNPVMLAEVDFRPTTINSFKLAAMKGEFKLIFDKVSKEWELYNLIEDPVEQNNLAERETAIKAELEGAIEKFHEKYQKDEGALGVPVQGGKDDGDGDEDEHSEEAEQLRSLGYL